MPVKELNISDIANEVAEAGLMTEANAARTVRTGTYRLHLRDIKGQQGEDPGAQPYLRIHADALQDGVHKGTVFFSGAWEKRYRETTSGRKLTKDSMLYGQLLKALGLGDGATVGTVVNAFQSTDVGAFVTETLQSPEKDKYVDVVDVDNLQGKDLENAMRRIREGRAVKLSEAGELIASGYTATNYVQSVFKLKD